ncbi:MAG: FHA domain-containing protein [Fischerella sp.]|nr:FHA domain-containing protein [Fischerella sp.]
MHKITFEWMEGNQIRSRTISSDEQTIVANKIRIGRDSSLCDVVVGDPTNQVSRLHAEI